MPKTTVYAVRKVATKERLTYRYRSHRDALDLLRQMQHRTTEPLEVYRTTQDLPRYQSSK
jgi:hypothetical protein